MRAVMDRLANDLRYAARALRKKPGFTAVAVITLALGIGANSAIFSVIDGLLLRPLPYGEPDRVVAVWNAWRGEPKTWISEPEIIDYREGTESLEHVAAYGLTSANLTGDGRPERVAAGVVTPDIFPALGVEALLGRTFAADEAEAGDVVVIAHGLWQRRFGGDPDAVGSTLRIDGDPFTVVGVMPAGFKLPMDYQRNRPTELWTPLTLAYESRGGHYLYGVGRLRSGATPGQATAELQRVVRGWVDDGLVEPDREFSAFAVPVRDEVVGEVRPALLVLLGAVGLVLLIACANVANLLLVRADARRRELAVRAAMGAGRRRIAGQLLTESGLLALAGGAAGLVLAFGGLRLLVALDPGSIPRIAEVGIDGRVLGFTLVVALATGLVFGLVPALRASRWHPAGVLREGGRGSSAGRGGRRFRRGLVAGQVALSVLLLIGAGLLIRSFQQLQRVDLGFESNGVLTMRMSLPSSDYPDPSDVVGFYRELTDRVETLPGVESVGASRLLPLTGTIGDWGVDIEGKPEPAGRNFNADWQVATPGYYRTMGLRLVRGRFPDETDRADGRPVVVINRTMAEAYWPGEDPIGWRMRLGSDEERPWYTVIGIVEDVRHNAVVEDARREMYHTPAQFALSIGGAPRSMTLVARTAGDPMALAASVREQIRALDATLPVSSVRSLDEVVSSALSEPRFMMTLLGIFAAVALVLAAVGLYGVIAYAVTRRTQEMGIRLALGAGPARVRRMVVREGAGMVLLGLLAGLAAALASTRVLESLLHEIAPTDAVTFVTAAAFLAAVALLAAYVPARRAAGVDPATALRED